VIALDQTALPLTQLPCPALPICTAAAHLETFSYSFVDSNARLACLSSIAI